jgi:hypothetical protein
MHDPKKLLDFLKVSGFKNNSVIHIEFEGRSPDPEYLVNGFFLKHPLRKDVEDKDPRAVKLIAEELKKNITRRFGETDLHLVLKALVGMGQK